MKSSKEVNPSSKRSPRTLITECLKKPLNLKEILIWAGSSAGRAPPSHGGGPGFKSRPVHHPSLGSQLSLIELTASAFVTDTKFISITVLFYRNTRSRCWSHKPIRIIFNNEYTEWMNLDPYNIRKVQVISSSSCLCKRMSGTSIRKVWSL